MAVVLGHNQYGKAETRVVRVFRDTEPHEIVDYNVSVALCGDLGAASLIDLMSTDDHGVLVAKRTLSSPAVADAHCGSWQGYTLCDNDILTRFTYNSGDHGNLSVEESYGGDIARSASTSSPFTGSTPEFSIQHDYTYTDGAVAAQLRK